MLFAPLHNGQGTGAQDTSFFISPLFVPLLDAAYPSPRAACIEMPRTGQMHCVSLSLACNINPNECSLSNSASVCPCTGDHLLFHFHPDCDVY